MKLDLTWDFANNPDKDWNTYLVYRKEQLSKLFDLKGTKFEEILLSGRYHDIKMCTARRIGKTYKTLCVMVFDLVHLGWYNGAALRKYQDLVKNTLLKLALQVVSDMINVGIFPPGIHALIKKQGDLITYLGRHIAFLSVYNPHTATGYPASNNRTLHKEQPLYCTVFIDEVIQANDNMSLTAEQTMDNIGVILDSLFRGHTAPYGAMSEQVIYALNPWDFQHAFYQKHIERYVPVGSHYVRKNKEQQVMINHRKLINAPHEVWEEEEHFDEVSETTRRSIVYRASSKIIPEKRWSAKMRQDYEQDKENNISKWYCVYMGIHGAMNDNSATHLDFMPKRPPIWDGKGTIVGLYFGFDRGIIDDNVTIIVGLAKDKEGHYKLVVLNGLILTKELNQTGQEKTIYMNIEFLTKWFDNHLDLVGYNNEFFLFADPAAKDFNQAFYEQLVKTPLGTRLFVKKAKKSGEGPNGWGIKTRQDFWNGLFSYDKFCFHKECPVKVIEEVWLNFQNCTNNDRGIRDEKPGRNKLDTTNALEYAISWLTKSFLWTK